MDHMSTAVRWVSGGVRHSNKKCLGWCCKYFNYMYLIISAWSLLSFFLKLHQLLLEVFRPSIWSLHSLTSFQAEVFPTTARSFQSFWWKFFQFLLLAFPAPMKSFFPFMLKAHLKRKLLVKVFPASVERFSRFCRKLLPKAFLASAGSFFSFYRKLL